MKKAIAIEEKIRLRAYYAWLNGSTAGAAADWLAAEQIEAAYAERRAAAARKAAETRKAKTAPKAPIAVLTSTKRRPAARLAITH